MPKKKKGPEKKDEKAPEVESKKEKVSVEKFESMVLELAKKGLTAEKIGEALRREGIHSKENKKISRILKDKETYKSPELENLQKKLDRINAHREKNMQDKRAMRERERIIALLRRQKKYHKII